MHFHIFTFTYIYIYTHFHLYTFVFTRSIFILHTVSFSAIMFGGGDITSPGDANSPVVRPKVYAFGRGRPVVPVNVASDYEVGQSTLGSPVGPVACSTPNTYTVKSTTERVVSSEALDNNPHMTHQLSDPSTAMHYTLHQPRDGQPQHPSQFTQGCTGNCLDTSKLNVVVQSNVKPPPFFRGDHTDSCSIHEWQDMMQSYMRRLKCSTSEMSDVIVSRLMGRARDIVKVSLRSNPGLRPDQNTMAVFDILKQNFSDLTYSSMPMADFYNTLPRAGEGVMDYWIRLNKAIDVADECLRRRGGCVEDTGAEVVMMFISHCPDPSLSMSFRFKAAEKWTAAEVQERVDDYQRDMRRSVARAQRAAPVSSYRPSQVAVNQSVAQYSEPCLSSEAISQPQPQTAPTVPAFPADRTTEEPGLREVVSMLNKVISLCSASLLPPCQDQPKQSPQCFQNQVSAPCRVCNSRDHSTFTHCRQHRLCRNCLKPGHFRKDCPTALRPPVLSVQATKNPLN